MFPKYAETGRVIVNARGVEALGGVVAPENRGRDSRLQTVGGVRRRVDLGGGAVRRVDGRGTTRLRTPRAGVRVNPAAVAALGTGGLTGGGQINVRPA